MARKTSISLEDEVWLAAKKRALDENTTLSQIVEKALRVYLFGR